MAKIKKRKLEELEHDEIMFAIYKEKVLTCQNQHDVINLLKWLSKFINPKL